MSNQGYKTSMADKALQAFPNGPSGEVEPIFKQTLKQLFEAGSFANVVINKKTAGKVRSPGRP